MCKKKYSLQQYKKIARQVAAEGCVLLENKNQTLPLRENDRVAIFGTNAFHYYKSGLGSGGLVHAKDVVSILDALKKEEKIVLDGKLMDLYDDWITEHPFDEGYGWGTVPWSQVEMPVSEEIIQEAAKRNDLALVQIGRTAGEDQDHTEEPGSFLLTETELDLLKKVCKHFSRSVVVLNVGNIIDMSWVKEMKPSAILYVWQGGQEGGNGVADVLLGRVNPCGKLPDTIAENLSDYPSTAHFGDERKNVYAEDIYVGYRYFETFAPDKVVYPFGFGLSYTTFHIESVLEQKSKEEMLVQATVTNTGTCPGKEVVQVYIQAPQGKLGKAKRVLAGFAKTKNLASGEKQMLSIVVPKEYFTSYDDSGVTGLPFCFLLEEGMYEVYCGNSVRDAKFCGKWLQEEEVLERHSQQCGVVEEAWRLHFGQDKERMPMRKKSMQERIKEELCQELPKTENKTYILQDVYEGRTDVASFVAQLSTEELIWLSRGEGMCSKKGVPGVASVFGGVNESLRAYGLPIVSCADGPSGIRMDCGTIACSLPNGTCIASSFDLELASKIYEFLGMEMRGNGIDVILGPGMNIHRNPLNGRNFEYFSEDPILTGKMAAAELMGLHKAGVEGTIKHFCANNQEKNRTQVEAVVSERALREIYLKCFEIAVKEGHAKAVMTTYGPINGIWTAGSYELCTKILREEWGFDGIVMTDWWACANWEGEAVDSQNHAAMVQAQNDLYMVCQDAETEQDNIQTALAEGRITKGQLQRNACNIVKFLLQSLALQLLMGKVTLEECKTFHQEMQTEELPKDIPLFRCREGQQEICIAADHPKCEQSYGLLFDVEIAKEENYQLQWEVSSRLGALAQLPVSIFVDGIYYETMSFRGTEGKWLIKTVDLKQLAAGRHHVKMVYEKVAMQLRGLCVKKWDKKEM